MSFIKLILFTFSFIQVVQLSKDEERLISDLFGNYTPAARPALKDNDTVTVKFGLTLSQIIDVQEKNQILVISAWTRQLWKNPLLTWDPNKYHGIKEINIDPQTIWKPDIVLYNNADDDKSFGGNLDRLNTRAILKYDGSTKWLAPIILKSKCDIDVKYFPFDTQKCPLKFGSWTYDKDRLNLVNEADDADLGMYSNNSEWYLADAECIRSDKEYVCCPGKLFPDVSFYITIARRSLFYLLNLIFPMTIIGMLTMCSFLLPAESGERISLAITLLLAMTVFMLVVADIIPATSDVVPLVGIFFNASMVEMVIMIVVLCYIMRLYHKDADDPPMSLWTRRVILDWLSYKVRIRVKEEADAKSDDLKISGPMQNFQNSILLNNQNEVLCLNKVGKPNSVHVKWANNKTSTEYARYHRTDSKDSKMRNSERSINNINETEIFLSKLDVLVQKLRTMDDDDLVKSEWRIVAMTIDRCLLLLFLASYLVILFACFLNAPGYVP